MIWTNFVSLGLSCKFADAGIEPLLASWNAHRMSGRNGGVPNVLAESTACLAAGIAHAVPFTENAIESFCTDGGMLTEASIYGYDPLEENMQLRDRRAELFHVDCNPRHLFSDVVHGNCNSLGGAIRHAAELSVHLSETL